jgi:hypothetical protein
MKELNNAEVERKSNIIEIIVVILLGITAVATAWSSWQEGLHGSQQDQKYTMANNLNAEANSMYNEGMQRMSQDLMIWNELSGLYIDHTFAEEKGDMEELEKLEYKIDQVMTDSVEPYPEFAAAIEWANTQEDYVSPFDDQAFVDTYFNTSSEKFDEAEVMLEAGNANNTNGDHQGLVSVIYAVVMFLLGITSTFKQLNAKYVLLGVSGVGFLIATIFMFTIPIVMP